MHLDFSILVVAFLCGPPNKGPNKFKIHAFKNVGFFKQRTEKEAI